GRAIGLVLALVLITLPPLGVIGWANPVTAAGVLFPGTGFAGLGLLCAVWVVFALGRFRAVASLAVIAAAANAVAVFQPAPAVHNWRGQDTAYGRLGTGPDAALAAYGRLLDLQDLAAALPPATVMVLPETLVGRYTSATTRVLDSTVAELRAKRSVVLVGAELADADGRLDNVLLALGTPDVIRQRIPIPVGMWRPWAADSYSMHLDGRGVALVAGRRIAPLICYEQLLVLPVLVSMANGADTLVGAANDWWARGTSAPVIQQQAMSAWGRLFGVPVVRATNL
ncbi:MAG: hypothetical protein ACREX0_09020, partial [Noviherbaspirillum sp.]